MKKIMISALAMLMLFGLSGCATTKAKKEDVQETSRFVIVEEGASWNVVYDKETKVMYTVSAGGYNCGNFTMLVDSDCKPLIYKGGSK